MSLDDRITSDREALAARTAQALPTHADTARALEEALAQRPKGEAMRSPYRPFIVATGALAAAAAVLICPIPYSHTAGWDVTLRAADGRVATIHLRGGSADEASRKAATLAQRAGGAATVLPHTERVWGNVYAMAREMLLRIDVNMEGKSDAAVEDEIRAQLAQQGWTPRDVQVQRGDGTSTVQVGASDGDGRQVQLVQRTEGASAQHVSMGVEAIDTKREPGMTDEQLKEKIQRQLAAKGMNADVTVEDGKVRVRVQDAMGTH